MYWIKKFFFLTIVLFTARHSVLSSTPTERFSIYIPDSLGTVDDSYQGSSDKTVVYIKDAHAFSEAQLHIAEIIKRLAQHNSLSLIGVEGAAGQLPIDDFRTFPMEQARNAIALNYLKKGIFSGAEYAAIIGEDSLQLMGIEDPALFQKNLATFNEAVADRETTIAAFIELHLVIADLKTYVFSNPLKKFEQYVAYYEDGKLGLSLFLSMLERHAQSAGIDFERFPELLKVRKSLAGGENIDFTRAEAQKNRIADTIVNTIRTLPIESDSKNIFENILQRKQEEFSDANDMRFLLDVASLLGISADSYSDLKSAVAQSDYAGDINFAALSREIEQCMHEIRLQLAESEPEKKLVAYAQYISLLERILSLEAVRTDVEQFVSDQKKSWDDCVFFLKQAVEEYSIPFDESDLNYINTALNTAYTFYDDAIMRDKTFIDNLLSAMESHEIAVLVAGGFHEDGILRLLKQNDISYLSVKPYLSSTQPDIAYVDKMQGLLFPPDGSANSNITVSLLYDGFFSSYPNLVSRFNADAVLMVVDLILAGNASVESIVTKIYSNYERTVPSAEYAASFSEQLQPVLDQLAQVSQSEPSVRVEIAQYLRQRIFDMVMDAQSQRTAVEIAPPNENLAVSVVIPVYNEFSNGSVFDLLESFVQQDADSSQFEILLVVNNSFADARDKTPGFLDNQRLIDMVRYLNAPVGVQQPSFVDDMTERQRQIIQAVRSKKLVVQVIDRSTDGVPGIVEQSAVRIGSIRNIGGYKALERFEMVNRDGFIANLDADTTVPADYISRLIQYSQLDSVDAVYANLRYEYAGGDEFLFKSHFVEGLAQLSWRFPEYLLSRAPQDVGTVRIITRASTFRTRGGFPDVTMSEDIHFSRLLNRSSSGIVSAYDLSVTTKDRMRDSRGFDSGVRRQFGQQMTYDEFVRFRGIESQPSIRAAFFIRDLRVRQRTGMTEDTLLRLLDFYGFTLSAQQMETFRSSGSTSSIMTSIEKANTFSLSAIEDNVIDFMENVLRKVSEREYAVFRAMLASEIEKENADIQRFRQQLRSVYDAVWDFPEKQTITSAQIRTLIRQNTDYPLLAILAKEEWFLDKLKTVGQQQYKEGYWSTLSYEFRDWLSEIDDSSRNVFRKGQLYHRVFNQFMQQALHKQSAFPVIHDYIVSVTGHTYVSAERKTTGAEAVPGTAAPLPIISHGLIESSL